MASIRKRGNSYLLVVSMGYTPDGRRRNPQQKTIKPPAGLTPKQTEKWLQEQVMIFEMSCKKLNPDIDRSITLEKYTEIWLQTIAPDKLAKSTLVREKQDIERFKPYLGSYKLVDLRPEHFRSLYAKLRKQKNKSNGKPLSEATVEGVHSCLCGILSDAMEGGYLDHNPAWRTYKYAGQKKEKKIADDETVKKLIQALETVSILHETYFKLIIATGMRRGECCALKWEDINYAERSIHVCRNAVKTTGDEIIVKAPKTKAGNRYVYFSAEMESLLREYDAFCAAETERYDRREQTKDDYVFRRKGMELPMTPSTFTWRFKKILKANDLPTDLNVHSLRHTAASLFIASGTEHPDKPVHKLSQQDIESIQTVASYLSDHYAFDIPLERLTQIACMGTTKLKSCFKKYHDCTITEYIQQRRMSQAEYLLAYTELTVGQVAQTVGYSTSSRFAELFRKSTGLLPLEYRKTAQRK